VSGVLETGRTVWSQGLSVGLAGSMHRQLTSASSHRNTPFSVKRMNSGERYPLGHFGHLIEPRKVPSSVGSAHLAQAQPNPHLDLKNRCR